MDDVFQRFIATDTASELHVFLWTLGIPDATRRAIVQEVLAIIARGEERVCTTTDS